MGQWLQAKWRRWFGYCDPDWQRFNAKCFRTGPCQWPLNLRRCPRLVPSQPEPQMDSEEK